MLTIRFFRTGKKHQPFFKIVVTDKKNPPKGGRFREQVGFYNPLTKEKNLKTERIKYWLSVGAQASDTVHNLLVKEGIIKEAKIPSHKKSKKKKEEPASAKDSAVGLTESPGKEEKKPPEEKSTKEVEEKAAEAPKKEIKTEEVKKG